MALMLPNSLPASILSLNVNGLRDQHKRRSLFAHLLNGPWHAIMLQETHSTDDHEVEEWMREGAGPGRPWQGLGFWCHGSRSRSCGVAILLHHTFDCSQRGGIRPTVTHKSPVGRVIRVEWSTNGNTTAMISVYAPVARSLRRAFFQQDGGLPVALQAGSSHNATLIVGGDFNCVIENRDIVGEAPAGGGGRMMGGQELQALMSAWGLEDAWRAKHPHTSELTHVATNRRSGARLDMMFIPSTVAQHQWLKHCSHVHAFPVGDHAPVLVQLADPSHPPQGPGLWRFPTELLQDSSFMHALRDSIDQLLQQWQPNTPMEHSNPASSLWEEVKALIKMRTIRHNHSQRAVAKAARAVAAANFRVTARGHTLVGQGLGVNGDGPRRVPIAGGEQNAYVPVVGEVQMMAVEEVENRIPNVGGENRAPQFAAQYVAQREAAHQAHMEGTTRQEEALHALWHQHGEQGTKWFHRLGKSPSASVPLIAIKKANGERVSLSEHGRLAMDAAFTEHYVGSGGVFAQPSGISAENRIIMLDSIDAFVPGHLHDDILGPSGDGSITEDCIRMVMKGVPVGKSPGCDGLPYEVYVALSDILLPPMVSAFNEAFQAGEEACLSDSQRTGIMALLHKGDNKPVDELSSFRPITLLNCDYKLVARVLVRRLTPMASTVVDATQTAFLPGRWIGDNILSHLEEIDYCKEEGQPGCIVFLDFSQAYDRLCREWLSLCMHRMGFPSLAIKWVGLMLKGTQVRARYHGWLTPLMQVPTGLAQGSPLSPLLWVLAAQPLSSRLRQLQRDGELGAIVMPNGQPAPPCHQHADDTTLHTDTAESAAVAITRAVVPFTSATNSCLNIGKSHGMGLGTLAHMTGHHGGTGVTFTTAPLRHLGILLGNEEEAAALAMYERRRGAVYGAIRAWAPFHLSALGRLHVAKSVIASTLSFHGSFVPMPGALTTHITGAIDHYVKVGAVLEGAEVARGGPPGKLIEALPREDGGLGRVDVEIQMRALQAKIGAALLHPQTHPWKVFMSHAFARAHPGLGVKVIVSRKTPHMGVGSGLGKRRLSYWQGIHRLQPFRLVPPSSLTSGHVRSEHLLFNARITQPNGGHFTSLPPGLPTACTTVGSLVACLTSPQPEAALAAHAMWECLPDEWKEHASFGPQRQPVWEVSEDGMFIRYARDRSVPLCRIEQDHSIVHDPSLAMAPHPGGAWKPAAVCFLPCKPHTAPSASLPPGGHLRGQLNTRHLQPFYLGQWEHAPLDPNVWAVAGGIPISHFSVRTARHRLLHLQASQGREGYVAGEGVRPRSWAVTGVSGSGVMAWDSRRVATLHDPAHRTALLPMRRSHSEMRGAGASGVVYDAIWMHRSGSRAHPIVRAASAGRALPAQPPRDAFDDSIDRLPLSVVRQPWKQVYRDLWQSRLDRDALHFAWRLLHQGLNLGSARLPGVLASGTMTNAGSCLCAADSCVNANHELTMVGGQTPLPLETHLHAFWECPVVSPAVKWLWDLWGRLTGHSPPSNPAILITGDPGLWQPPTKAQRKLWVCLRVTFLHNIWRLRHRRRVEGRQFTATAIVSATGAALERLMLAEFNIATKDLCREGGVGHQWVRGGRRRLTLGAFEKQWCHRRVLAHVVRCAGNAPPKLILHIPSALPA
jgi:exonuclease III